MSLFVGEGRYSECLKELVKSLGGIEVLCLDYDCDYSGYIDIDVLLEDGRVFSYKYYYGSCSGCDEWEARELSDDEIIEVMKQECTIFDNRYQYDKWRRMVNGESELPEKFLDDDLFEAE